MPTQEIDMATAAGRRLDVVLLAARAEVVTDFLICGHRAHSARVRWVGLPADRRFVWVLTSVAPGVRPDNERIAVLQVVGYAFDRRAAYAALRTAATPFRADDGAGLARGVASGLACSGIPALGATVAFGGPTWLRILLGATLVPSAVGMLARLCRWHSRAARAARAALRDETLYLVPVPCGARR